MLASICATTRFFPHLFRCVSLMCILNVSDEVHMWVHNHLVYFFGAKQAYPVIGTLTEV